MSSSPPHQSTHCCIPAGNAHLLKSAELGKPLFPGIHKSLFPTALETVSRGGALSRDTGWLAGSSPPEGHRARTIFENLIMLLLLNFPQDALDSVKVHHDHLSHKHTRTRFCGLMTRPTCTRSRPVWPPYRTDDGAAHEGQYVHVITGDQV